MQHHFSKSDHNKTASVRFGDTVVIELEETPTTGYMWDAITNDPVAQLQSSNFEFASQAMGGGGKRKLIFTVAGAGDGSITLQQRQQWTGDVADTFSIHLQSQ